ncbi:MAG: 4-(cytidine 5'-diphospho)-2-C-methyl-D-erythritol kinase [Burkholderiales bacterium]|nr:4-(cytidine 5'-diphospho)-2-C-methyl-D-erythritol kinase [Burkholderiales bacterium]
MNETDTSLTAMAPAKLNLFLHVVGRRADGYHMMQSVFVLLDIGDTLHFTTRRDGVIRRLSDLPGVKAEDDLVVRAAQALKREAETVSGQAGLGVDITVEKKLPMGGGLGGGSSDAASTILALNRLWNLGFSTERLSAIGLGLGADVPFFIFGCNAFAEGIGEKLSPVELPRWWYLVLTPPEHVPTPVVFAHAELTRDTFPIKISDFSANGLVKMRNDLQPVVLKTFPAVLRCFEALQVVSQKSVFGVRMTGSGACVFAAFEVEHDAREAFQLLQPEYSGFVAQGLSRHPFS